MGFSSGDAPRTRPSHASSTPTCLVWLAEKTNLVLKFVQTDNFIISTYRTTDQKKGNGHWLRENFQERFLLNLTPFDIFCLPKPYLKSDETWVKGPKRFETWYGRMPCGPGSRSKSHGLRTLIRIQGSER
ncbi:hypothetical protein NC653_020425 [Populus alba x Populus x berolinensis]|uniref:Uncharacterized protein n=1 Tax=Populus alba x Populus x berolinensis TaxID=444605 RepID=A0AAD6QCE4_9ROSI|nr:hypothetical protein NC653_020425 [Populus alba x Populus x berolinensis]